jgi:hypothetical protein
MPLRASGAFMARYGGKIMSLAESHSSCFKLCCIENYSQETALLATDEGKNRSKCSFCSHLHAGMNKAESRI